MYIVRSFFIFGEWKRWNYWSVSWWRKYPSLAATYCLITYIPTFVAVLYPLYIRPLPFTMSNANKYGFRPLRNYGNEYNWRYWLDKRRNKSQLRTWETMMHICQFVMFVYSSFLAIDGRTSPLSPAKYVSSKIVSSLAQEGKKGWLIWQAFG